MNNFVEINEVGCYSTGRRDEHDRLIYDRVIEGKIIINLDLIRCISVSGFDWEDSDKHIIKEGSQRYTVYFDKDRSVNTDIESYNKIKELVLKNNIDMICE